MTLRTHLNHDFQSRRTRSHRARSAWTATAVLCLAGACAAPALAQQAGSERFNDPDISAAVERDLLIDARVNGNAVDTTVNDGVVTLTGSVRTPLAKDRAVALAESTRGVRAVVDRLEVNPASRADDLIATDLEEAFLYNPALNGSSIKATVNNGNVALLGTVDSQRRVKIAERAAKGIKGVRMVTTSGLRVETPASRSAEAIREDVLAALRWNPWVHAWPIDVSVDDGEVTLSGAVGSLAERRVAASLAWVDGVTGVDATGLDIEWWAENRSDADPAQRYRSDGELTKAINDALREDPRVKESNVTVSADAGAVTLRGTVPSFQAKRAAEADARHTVGVARVRNLLKVRYPQPVSDETLAQRVSEAFERDPFLDREDLLIDVSGGVARIYGESDTLWARTHADDVASSIDGIVDVRMYAGVESAPAPDKSDWEIAQDIEDELFWSPFVDSDQVSVSVSQGIATLSGTVDSLTERRIAEENAREGGAVGVVNELRMQIMNDGS